MTMSRSNMEVPNVRYCITCEQLIRNGMMTCVDCEKILDIIAGSPVPSFQYNTNNTGPVLSQGSENLCCMCGIPTMLGSQFCSECECSMAMVLEDPEYALDAPQSQTNTREVTQDMENTKNDDSDEEIEVVAELTETELMMQRFEEAKESGDVVELLDDDDDEPPPSKVAAIANTGITNYESDDEIQFIRTTSSARI